MNLYRDVAVDKLEFCPNCNLFVNASCISENGYLCKPCHRKHKIIMRGWALLVVGFIALVSCTGCAVKPVGAGTGAYRPGEIVQARMFTNFPQYEGELVTVKDGLGWKWIRGSWFQGNALRVYEVETSDGRRLAAQEFQLKKITKGELK